jgi:hypothetical protein
MTSRVLTVAALGPMSFATGWEIGALIGPAAGSVLVGALCLALGVETGTLSALRRSAS